MDSVVSKSSWKALHVVGEQSAAKYKSEQFVSDMEMKNELRRLCERDCTEGNVNVPEEVRIKKHSSNP
jgi:hypothetical protein